MTKQARVVVTYNPRGGNLKGEGKQEHGFYIRQAVLDNIEAVLAPKEGGRLVSGGFLGDALGTKPNSTEASPTPTETQDSEGPQTLPTDGATKPTGLPVNDQPVSTLTSGPNDPPIPTAPPPEAAPPAPDNRSPPAPEIQPPAAPQPADPAPETPSPPQPTPAPAPSDVPPQAPATPPKDSPPPPATPSGSEGAPPPASPVPDGAPLAPAPAQP